MEKMPVRRVIEAIVTIVMIVTVVTVFLLMNNHVL